MSRDLIGYTGGVMSFVGLLLYLAVAQAQLQPMLLDLPPRTQWMETSDQLIAVVPHADAESEVAVHFDESKKILTLGLRSAKHPEQGFVLHKTSVGIDLQPKFKVFKSPQQPERIFVANEKPGSGGYQEIAFRELSPRDLGGAAAFPEAPSVQDVRTLRRPASERPASSRRLGVTPSGDGRDTSGIFETSPFTR